MWRTCPAGAGSCWKWLFASNGRKNRAWSPAGELLTAVAAEVLNRVLIRMQLNLSGL